MKIERTPMSAAVISDANRTRIAKNGTEPAPSSVVARISLDQSSASDDVDMAKVEAIKQAIKDGRYQINADKIADGLISSMREWLSN